MLNLLNLEQHLENAKPTTVRVAIPCYYNFGVLTSCGVPDTVDGIHISVLTNGESPAPPTTGAAN